MRLQILKSFRFAHQGVNIRQYEPGPLDTDDDELVKMALGEGWAIADEKVATKALGGSPRNKSFSGAPEVAKVARRRGRPRTKLTKE